MRLITKTRQDYNVTDGKGVIFVEYDIELSRPIEYDALYHEKHIG